MPDLQNLPYLIRLLDDDDPAVNRAVCDQLENYGGDISEDLMALGLSVPQAGRTRLTALLADGRRKSLESQWQVPSSGVGGWEDDWDSFEHALRLISDFLHDGITLRCPLPDALDLLVDQANEAVPGADAEGLRKWLFAKGQFKGAKSDADASEYYDLCHVVDTQRGNPTSLAFLFLLLGRRLGVEVHACNYPGHFLAMLLRNGRATLVDCFHLGRTFDAQDLLAEHPEISSFARDAVREPAHLGVILLRFISELRNSLLAEGRKEDGALLERLMNTLKK